MSWIKKKQSLLFVLFFLFSCSVYGNEQVIDYNVKFSGVDDKKIQNLLQEASELIKLKKHPPKTEGSLKRRMELDIPHLIKALHSRAFYNAKITAAVDGSKTPYEVTFFIDTGPIYPIASLQVYPESLNICEKELGITLGAPAYTSDINAAEEALIHTLSKKGYPLAKLINRDVFADQKSKDIHIKIYLEPGPLAFFGKTSITGNESVKKTFIDRKIDWRQGEIYDPSKIDSTMNGLEAAGVFSSISITHEDLVDNENFLPMNILLTEGKQRSIGIGLGYSTQRGPGITAEWEHRNYHGVGEKLGLNINALLDTQEATVCYLIPDFLHRNQDLIYVAEVEHDTTKGFEMSSYSLSSTIERQISNELSASYGAMFELLKSTKEKESGKKEDGTYNLARVPLKLRWSTIDDLLDPTQGETLFFKAIPTVQIGNNPFIYTITTLTGSIYKPVSKEKKMVIAAKISLGSIWGASKNLIPGSERFNAGSENTIRGYNYETVSPLSADGDPTGGRSQTLYSLEARLRTSEKWGAVFFYDAGHVSSQIFPQFNKKVLQSVGIGARYFTPVGPLRLDFAYPLNRRLALDKKEHKKKYIDKPFQIYFSVGQTF